MQKNVVSCNTVSTVELMNIAFVILWLHMISWLANASDKKWSLNEPAGQRGYHLAKWLRRTLAEHKNAVIA